MEHQLASQLEQEEAHVSELERELTSVERDLSWYQTFDVERANRTLLDTKRNLAESASEIERLKASRPPFEASAAISLVSTSLWSLLDPRRLLSSESAVAKRIMAEKRAEVKRIDGSIQAATVRIKRLCEQATDAEHALKRYRDFDGLQAQAIIASISLEMQHLRPGLERLRERNRALEALIAQPKYELADQQREQRKLRYQLDRAEHYDAALTAAAESRQRRAIHERCKEELGDSSPGSAKQKIIKRLESVERTIAKLRDRIQLEVDRASNDIRELIIDGSNLCFHGPRNAQKYVGPAALEAIAGELAGRLKVIVVFDASLEERLNADGTDVVSRFARIGVEAHIAGPGVAADETILRLAEHSKYVYVLSNDYFRDYPEKAALREGRVLRYERVSNRIMVHVLNADVAFAKA